MLRISQFCILFVAAMPLFTIPASADNEPHNSVTCHSPYIIDGDTFQCDDTRIRLAGIDAPETDGHCRQGRRCVQGDAEAAKNHLNELTRTKVECTAIDTDHYGRSIALCKASGVDLSCAMIGSGHAIPRYRQINCPSSQTVNP